MAIYHRVGFVLALLAAVESFAAPVISTGMLVASAQLLDVKWTQPYILLAVFSSLLCYVLIREEAVQQQRLFLSGWTIATRIGLAWMGVVALLLLIGYATKVSAVFSRRALFVWFITTPPLLMVVPIVLRQWMRRFAVASGNARTVAIAGVNHASRELANTIRRRPELGLEQKGFFDDRSYGRLDIARKDLVGTLAELPEITQRRHIDVIFVALPYHLERTKMLLNELRDTTASVYLIPDISFVDLVQARADDIDGVPVIALCETPFQGWTGFKKRATDVVLASLMLVFALPLMALIAGAIKLTSPGKVIFKQRRYGLDGEQIIVYKFRTMNVTEDGDTIRQAKKNDHRVTPIGRLLRRYSLDELPQLFNVLQGNMSLVGPRPHAVAHNEEYRKLITGYMVRHKVPPGITGLAQINGCRGETADVEDMRRRINHDLDYLRRWSLALDLKILFKTVATLVRDEKAY